MKKYFYLLLVGFAVFLLSSCKENEIGPSSENTGVPPPLTEAVVENLPGAVKITYPQPTNKNILYVKAECFLNGELRLEKASIYNNEIIIEGFGKSENYEVKLYTVNRAEEPSAPYNVTVHPLPPTVQTVFSDLTLEEDFGGALVKINNPTEAELRLVMLAMDDTGDWVTAETYYTQQISGAFALRGYEPEPRKFGVYLRDRWDNRSDTLIKTLTPVFEEKLAKDKFRALNLPTDAPEGYGWAMPNLWNDRILTHTSIDDPGFHTAPGSGFPQWFTFDLGVNASLSRFKIYQRGGFYTFNSGNPRKFEVWGSNDPATDGSWDNWTRLLACESVKPSGRPLGDNSDEDLAKVAAGEEFSFQPGTPPMRYIRIKTLETWGGSDALHIIEIEFWGSSN
ncbi:uncharacterized protein DUF4959 [Anseongella ginsenosidimutans]|uniref:Uncharacterized protein DUF4959 n=1 Tax=Anseongella ginsenosidimutans TaxID=496056 RepID=A0A4R3KUY1_9SPHI|nr:DUF5000 domain-containing lipoprotein [Anseongella ginsenosidimutans]QEC53051.1 DUF5126 domain-containing protein [Anseongella ginsenosidimutans]TCS87667.1 uncharacterized protein DUF4959 [Anseongella ginsenosidimutans]